MKNRNDHSAIRALTIDDHGLARQIVINALHTLDIIKVDESSDPAQGQAMIEQAQRDGAPYDIVFLDWSMPALEGIKILQHFHEKPEHANTAFIMFTAASEKTEMLQAIRAGVMAFIPKPASKETIVRKIAEVLTLKGKHPKN